MDHGASNRNPTCQEAGSTWPPGVQVALGLLVCASAFFLLGRWSHGDPPPVVAREVETAALDLNFATKSELRLLPGLGDALAQRVVDHRQRVGRFRSVEDLRKVSGIGPKTLERLRPYVFVTLPEAFVADDESEPMAAASKSSLRGTTVSKKASELTEPINVNAANQTELQKLPGIGPKLSQRILDERARAPFKSIDELRRVPGIGPKTLEKVRPYVTIE